MTGDTGAGDVRMPAAVDVFGLDKDDLVDPISDIITTGEFYERAARRDHLHPIAGGRS